MDTIYPLLHNTYVMLGSHTFQNIPINHFSCIYTYTQIHGVHWVSLVCQMVCGVVTCWSQFWSHHCCVCAVLSKFICHYLGDSYCDTISVTCSNLLCDYVQYYTAINIIQFKSRVILTHQIPVKYTLDFPILQHYPPSVPRSLSKRNPTDGFAFAWGRNSPDCLSQLVFYRHYRDFMPFNST